MGRKTGRIITLRDEMIMTSLYVPLGLTTEQIAKMYFSSQAYLKDPNTNKLRYSVSSAKARLYKLRNEGFIETQRYTPIGETGTVRYWYLTQKKYKREAKAADRRNEHCPELPKRLTHHFKTTEIYARIQPRFNELFGDLSPDEYSGWQWRNESHSFCEFQYQGKTKKHQPDAEVHLPDGRVFFIERQTEDSRKSASVFKDKVEGCRSYINWKGLSTSTAKILFVCDTERDRGYAKKACQEAGVPGVVGGPDKMVGYLIKRAEEVFESKEGAA